MLAVLVQIITAVWVIAIIGMLLEVVTRKTIKAVDNLTYVAIAVTLIALLVGVFQ